MLGAAGFAEGPGSGAVVEAAPSVGVRAAGFDAVADNFGGATSPFAFVEGVEAVVGLEAAVAGG